MIYQSFLAPTRRRLRRKHGFVQRQQLSPAEIQLAEYRWPFGEVSDADVPDIYVPFEEPVGETTFYDAYGRELTYSTSAPVSVLGGAVGETAARYTDSPGNGHILSGTNIGEIIDIDKDWTMEVNIRLDNNSTHFPWGCWSNEFSPTRILFYCRITTSRHFQIVMQGNNGGVGTTLSPSDSNFRIHAGSSVYHIGVTYRASDRRFFFARNGLVKDMGVLSGSFTKFDGDLYAGRPMYIGSYNPTASSIAGDLDDFKVTAAAKYTSSYSVAEARQPIDTEYAIGENGNGGYSVVGTYLGIPTGGQPSLDLSLIGDSTLFNGGGQRADLGSLALTPSVGAAGLSSDVFLKPTVVDGSDRYIYDFKSGSDAAPSHSLLSAYIRGSDGHIVVAGASGPDEALPVLDSGVVAVAGQKYYLGVSFDFITGDRVISVNGQSVADNVSFSSSSLTMGDNETYSDWLAGNSSGGSAYGGFMQQLRVGNRSLTAEDFGEVHSRLLGFN